MEVDTVLEASEQADKKKSRLNALIAITVALIAALMAISNVKDGNIVQAMQQSQADRVDHWSWYQAKKSRLAVAESTLTILEIQPQTAARDKAMAKWKGERDKQKTESEDVKNQAEQDAKEYDKWNIHDDQFDASEALLSLSITLLAMTSLTQKKWLYGVALVPAAFGATMAIAGLFNLSLHSAWLAKVLGT